MRSMYRTVYSVYSLTFSSIFREETRDLGAISAFFKKANHRWLYGPILDHGSGTDKFRLFSGFNVNSLKRQLGLNALRGFARLLSHCFSDAVAKAASEETGAANCQGPQLFNLLQGFRLLQRLRAIG